jgi:hypothetical protein
MNLETNIYARKEGRIESTSELRIYQTGGEQTTERIMERRKENKEEGKEGRGKEIRERK